MRTKSVGVSNRSRRVLYLFARIATLECDAEYIEAVRKDIEASSCSNYFYQSEFYPPQILSCGNGALCGAVDDYTYVKDVLKECFNSAERIYTPPSASNCDTQQHALSCPRGGFPSIRHNEIRDVTANLLTEVCHDVLVEPDLQPLTGETMTTYTTSNSTEGARLDIAVNGFWGGRYERTFMDVRVFDPHAPSNNNTNISNCYRKHENEKKRAYEQRIRDVEHASFTPLVFSATGGMAKQSTTFYKRLASLLADKWDHTYTLYRLRCRLSFSLLRSAIQCIRGARSSCGHAIHSSSPIDLISTEAHFSQQ